MPTMPDKRNVIPPSAMTDEHLVNAIGYCERRLVELRLEQSARGIDRRANRFRQRDPRQFDKGRAMPPIEEIREAVRARPLGEMVRAPVVGRCLGCSVELELEFEPTVALLSRCPNCWGREGFDPLPRSDGEARLAECRECELQFRVEAGAQLPIVCQECAGTEIRFVPRPRGRPRKAKPKPIESRFDVIGEELAAELAVLMACEDCGERFPLSETECPGCGARYELELKKEEQESNGT